MALHSVLAAVMSEGFRLHCWPVSESSSSCEKWVARPLRKQDTRSAAWPLKNQFSGWKHGGQNNRIRSSSALCCVPLLASLFNDGHKRQRTAAPVSGQRKSHCSSSYSIPVGGRFFFLFWCFYGNWPINLMDWSVKHWMVHRRAIEHYSDEVFFLGQPGILHHPCSLIKTQQDFSIGLWGKLLQSDLTTCFLREIITSEYYWKKSNTPLWFFTFML